MEAPLVEVKDVGKRYCRDLKRSLLYCVQDIARECSALPPRAGLRKDEFWANYGISFELHRGTCLGLLGSNGAGKSTLLKMIAGLTKPDEGEIIVRGRVGALIELGAGFNPILSGRENIYVNGAVLGMTKLEINRKLDDIIAFADIGDFIESPVQSYSSGMKVRLGFAIAAHLEPDILLIDEVLAVGDAKFRFKCLAKIKELLNSGVAAIFVSHNSMQIMRICNECLVFNQGKIATRGSVERALIEYSILSTKQSRTDMLTIPPVIRCMHGEDLRVKIRVNNGLQKCRLLFRIDSANGSVVTGKSTYLEWGNTDLDVVTVCLPSIKLFSGTYAIFIACMNEKDELIFEAPNCSQLIVEGMMPDRICKGYVGESLMEIKFEK